MANKRNETWIKLRQQFSMSGKKIGHFDHPLQSYCDFLLGSYIWATMYIVVKFHGSRGSIKG